MRSNALHVQTKGSNVWLDCTNLEYLRLPRFETPREYQEWSDHRAGVLEDAKWHPMLSYTVEAHPHHSNDEGICRINAPLKPDEKRRCPYCPGLIIRYGDKPHEAAWFPNAKVIHK